MVQLIIIQLLTLAFIAGFVYQQHAVIKMMIDYVPSGTSASKQFHRGNATIALVFFFMALVACGWIGLVLSALWYSVLFDPITIKANWPTRKWWELGNEAWTDKTLKKIFGTRAGLWKAVILIAIIAVLNFIITKYPTLIHIKIF